MNKAGKKWEEEGNVSPPDRRNYVASGEDLRPQKLPALPRVHGNLSPCTAALVFIDEELQLFGLCHYTQLPVNHAHTERPQSLSISKQHGWSWHRQKSSRDKELFIVAAVGERKYLQILTFNTASFLKIIMIDFLFVLRFSEIKEV